ncbi:hypothetical protein STURO_v1c02940 [Spiroplasma turonicum]|nr:hypothetical protein STURO_v1c02940 [Spiroplasma turonicum]
MRDIKLGIDEAEKAQKEYDDVKNYLSKQKYTSFYEERKRISKLFCSMKLSKPIEEVFEAFLDISIEDINPNINKEDFEEGQWYRSSKKNNNNLFRLETLQKNKEISLSWVAKKQLFIKSVKFKKNSSNTKTKLTYFDYVKGDTSIQGFFERHILNTYIKKQVLAFRIQIFKTSIKLNLVKEKDIPKVNKKIAKLSEYIKTMI